MAIINICAAWQKRLVHRFYFYKGIAYFILLFAGIRGTMISASKRATSNTTNITLEFIFLFNQ